MLRSSISKKTRLWGQITAKGYWLLALLEKSCESLIVIVENEILDKVDLWYDPSVTFLWPTVLQ